MLDGYQTFGAYPPVEGVYAMYMTERYQDDDGYERVRMNIDLFNNGNMVAPTMDNVKLSFDLLASGAEYLSRSAFEFFASAARQSGPILDAEEVDSMFVSLDRGCESEGGLGRGDGKLSVSEWFQGVVGSIST